MKTIDEYKSEFIELARQFEKEHGCSIKMVQIEKYSKSHCTQFGQEYDTYHYSCNITT